MTVPTTRWRDRERELVASLLRRLPIGVTRRLRRRLTLRYARPDGPIVAAPLWLGHRLLLDLRSSVQTAVYFSGRFDDELIAFARRVVGRPGAVAVDVGANIGYWSVPLAQQLQAVGGRLLAVEPVAANERRLRQNVALNGVRDTVQPVRAALSDGEGTVALSLREEFAEGAATGNASVAIADGGDGPLRVEDVSTVTLDTLVDGSIGELELLKLDVEGHEDAVLRGGLRTIRRCQPVIIMEWNPVYYHRRGIDPTTAFASVMDGLGYRVLRRDGDRWRVSGTISSPKELDNLVLAPADRLEGVKRVLDGATGGSGRRPRRPAA